MRRERLFSPFPLLIAGAVVGCGGRTLEPGDASADDAEGDPSDASIADAGFNGFDSALSFEDAGEVMIGANGDCVPDCPTTDYCFAIVRVGGRFPRSNRDPADAAPQGCYPFPSACTAAPTCDCVLAHMGNPGPLCLNQGQTVCSEDAGAMHVVCTEYLP